MGKTTSIAWCDSTVTPIFGCSKASEACEHCYAEKIAVMRAHNPKVAHLYEGTIKDGHWSGRLNLFPERMEETFRWRASRRIFVASQSDLFHQAVPTSFLDAVFSAIVRAPQHTFILLTKRARRMRDYLRELDSLGDAARRERLADATWNPALRPPNSSAEAAAHRAALEHPLGWPLRNVHTYVTIENQQRMEERLPALLETPSVLRGVSMEPLLDDIDLTRCPRGEYSALDDDFHNAFSGDGWSVDCMEYPATSKNGPRIGHVIAGGETGTRWARASLPAWFRAQRDQCAKYGCAFTFKQWGEWSPGPPVIPGATFKGVPGALPDGTVLKRWGAKATGRLLDGVEHLALPQIGDAAKRG